MKGMWKIIYALFFGFSTQANATEEEPTIDSRVTSIGMHVSTVKVSSSGFYVGQIKATPTVGADVYIQIGRQWTTGLSVDVSGNVYFNSDAGFRYYPWSVPGRRLTSHAYGSVEYDDKIRPFFVIGGSRGQLRLQTQDEIGATQINAQYLGVLIGTGLSTRINSSVDLNLSATYSKLVATADAVVTFNGTRTAITAGGSLFF